ncbi:monooxygenase FAD-binding protein [Xylogone sp. PMI_703]|nr:monooxygenase FAD-binding protein [Xylogone sp. PMI_703]
MTPPTVLIVGCGIAGPVAAILYKRKGYHPIVFEKVSELGDAGASLLLMPNGMIVLDLIGLADNVKSESNPLKRIWDGKSTGETLGQSDIPSIFPEKYRQPAAGIRRTTLNLMMKKMLLDQGVEVREGWELIDIEESKESVTAIFNGNRSVTGSFLVGCDGIKAASRRILLKNQGIIEGAPIYAGLVQTAGISKTPEALKTMPSLRNWYGEGIHIVAYPVSKTHTSWAITTPESVQEAETWRLYSQSQRETQLQKLLVMLEGWDPSVIEIVTSPERLVKYGIFDRDELLPSQWYSERCVLIGDAAHPTSPHLGQGANQALEDCFNLCHSMPSLIPGSDDFEQSSAVLGPNLCNDIFRPFAEKRHPRTTELVKGARAQGTRRVITDPALCKQRDIDIAASWPDAEAIAMRYDKLLREPFQTLES